MAAEPLNSPACCMQQIMPPRLVELSLGGMELSFIDSTQVHGIIPDSSSGSCKFSERALNHWNCQLLHGTRL